MKLAAVLRKVGGLNDPAAVDVQGGQQDRGAVADILVLLAGRAAGGDRLGWPGAAAGTDPGLLIHRQHQRVGRRDQVQPADVGGALPEAGVVGAGDPAAHPVRLDVQVGQDPADLGGRDSHVGQFLGQLGMAPVAGRIGRLLGHGGHDPQPLIVVIDQRAARPLAVLKAGQAFGLKAAAPLGHGVLVHAHQGGDLAVGEAVGGQQHDPGPLGGPLWGGVGADPALQLGAFLLGDHKGWHGRHPAAPQAASLRSPPYVGN
jgi:hypothetical protein